MCGVNGMSAYSAFTLGVAGNRTSHLVAKGDCDAAAATTAAGAFNKLARQPFFPNRKCTNGDILVFFEGHDSNAADWSIHSILMRRSSDNGATWGPIKTVYRDASYSYGVHWLNTGAVGIDATTGRVHLLFTMTQNGTAGTPAAVGDVLAKYLYSDDHGATWGGTTATDGTPRDLTTTLKKQSGTTPPYDELNQAWGWNIFGPGSMIQLRNGSNAGRIMCAANHRYSATNSDTAWAHVVYTDDNGANWALGGGLQETVAGNDHSVEPTIAEYGSSGAVYMQMRINTGGSSGYRGSSRSTDGGVTWADMTINDGSGGTTALAGISTSGAVVGTNTGVLYCSFPNDTTIRSHGKIWKSTDNGVTWPTSKTLTSLPFGYSALMLVDQQSLLASFETSEHVSDINSDGQASYEYLGIRRIPLSWVDSTTPAYSLYNFNEASSGAVPTTGSPIKDYGDQGAHGFGGAGGTYSASGLVCDGVAIAATLAQLNNATTAGSKGHSFDMRADDCVVEVIISGATSNTNTRRICGNRNATTTAGWNLNITALHKASFSHGDGTNSSTATSSVSVDTGDRFYIRGYWDKTNHRTKIVVQNLTAGTAAVTTNSGAESPGNITSTVSSAACTVGARPDGTEPTPCTVEVLRFTRGVPNSYITGTETKETLAQLLGYNISTPSTAPSNITGLKLWLAATYDHGRAAGTDRYGAHSKLAFPTSTATTYTWQAKGQGITGYRDIAQDKLFTFGNSANRGAWTDSDTTIGRHWRLSYQGGTPATGYFYRAATTDYDFIQGTGRFTFSCVFKLVSLPNICTLFDNCLNNLSNPGMSLLITNSTTISIRMPRSGGTALLDSSYTVSALSTSNWYFLALTGDATNVKLYLGAYSGTAPNSAPTLGAASSKAYTDTTFGGANNSKALGIGGRADDSSSYMGNVRLKNVLLYDDDIGATAVQQLATFGAQY